MKEYKLTIEDYLPQTPQELYKICLFNMLAAMQAKDDKKARYWFKHYKEVVL